MEPQYRPRRRAGLLATFTALAVAATAGLTACGSGTASGSSSALPSAGGSVQPMPSGPVNPGGPMSPSPGQSGSPTGPAAGAPAPGASPAGFPATGYSAAGTVLTVYFTAGVCDKYGVTADQSQAGKVLVTVVVTDRHPQGQMCPLVMTMQHATVDLGRPLDGREVVDARSGKQLPQRQSFTSGMESGGPVTG